jgi:ketosteroid isomerase-like protein
MRTIGFLGAAALLGVMGCQPAETPQQMQARMDQESAAFKQFVGGVTKRWERWDAAGQADSIANIYMDQGREMPPNAPAVVGRNALRTSAAAEFGMGKVSVHITSESSVANGPLGIDRGSYNFTFTANKGMKPTAGIMMPPSADTGKYLAHWHKVNGTWQLAELIVNSNLPVGGAAPARAPARGRTPAKAPAKAPAKRKR